MTKLGRDADGRLPSYAWPGGYPIYYLTADGGTLCPTCANGGNGSRAADRLDAECPDDDQWRVDDYGINWEDPDLTCDHCNQRIESAYAGDDTKRSY